VTTAFHSPKLLDLREGDDYIVEQSGCRTGTELIRSRSFVIENEKIVRIMRLPRNNRKNQLPSWEGGQRKRDGPSEKSKLHPKHVGAAFPKIATNREKSPAWQAKVRGGA